MHNGRVCRPIAAISNKEVSKALGLSQFDQNTQVLHYIEKDGQYNFVKQSMPINQVFPSSKAIII